MCGICGLWFGSKTEEEILQRYGLQMSNNLYKRGPDSGGIWSDPNLGIVLSHRRLSIRDLTLNGSQPMVSSNQNYIIIFNGEIYNFELLRSELKSHKWRGSSDTEVLLHAIQVWGLEKTLKKCYGMFAFALFDKKDESITLVRDRYGEKPLFYFFDENNIVFSSELKAIKKFFEKQNLEIDSQSSKLFSCLGYIPAPLTIFKKTYKVLPAQIIKIKQKKNNRKR